MLGQANPLLASSERRLHRFHPEPVRKDITAVQQGSKYSFNTLRRPTQPLLDQSQRHDIRVNSLDHARDTHQLLPTKQPLHHTPETTRLSSVIILLPVNHAQGTAWTRAIYAHRSKPLLRAVLDNKRKTTKQQIRLGNAGGIIASKPQSSLSDGLEV